MIEISDQLFAKTVDGKLAVAEQIFDGEERQSEVNKRLEDTMSSTFRIIHHDKYIFALTDNQGRSLMTIDFQGDFWTKSGMSDEMREKLTLLLEQVAALQETTKVIKVVENGEYVTVFTDLNGKVLFGYKNNEGFFAPKGMTEDAKKRFKLIEEQIEGIKYVENGEYLIAFTSNEGQLLLGIRQDGSINCKDIRQLWDSLTKLETAFADHKTFFDSIFEVTDEDGWLLLVSDKGRHIALKMDDEGVFTFTKEVNAPNLPFHIIESENYFEFFTKDGRHLMSIDKKGNTVVNGLKIGTFGAEMQAIDNDKYLVLLSDRQGKRLAAYNNITGQWETSNIKAKSIEAPGIGVLIDNEQYSLVFTTPNHKVMFGFKKDGSGLYCPVGQPEETKKEIKRINQKISDFEEKINKPQIIEITNKAIDKVMLNGNAGRGYLGNVALQEPGLTDYCIIMMYGQSLSNGSENPAGFDDPVVDGCFMLGDNVWTKNGSVLNGLRVGGSVRADGVATGTRQDTIVSTVNTFVSLYKKERPWDKNTKFIACSLGVGGRTVAQLSGNMYSDKKNTTRRYPMCNEQQLEDRVRPFFESVKAIADAEGKTVSLSAVFWKQGESDYGTGYIGKTYEEWRDIVVNQETTSSNAMQGSKDAYKKGLTILKEDIFALAKEIFGDAQQNSPVFMPYSVCGTYISNAYQTINDATYEMANEQDDVVQVGPTYVTPDYEGGHLAMNGYRWFGEYCAKALYYVFLKHMDFRPLQPYGFDIKDNKVYIYINPIVPPLRIDTYTIDDIYKNRGFSVRMGTVAQLDANKTMTSGGLLQTITDVSIIENCIVLTCGNIEKFEGAVEVSYAGQGESGYGGHNQGAGNVRDSDTWVAKYNYRNDMSDHGSRRTFNVWTSVRVATESDLTDYEPWDSATTYNYGDMCLITNTTNNVTYLVKSMKDANKNLSPFSGGTTWRTYNLWSGSTKATEEELSTLQYWDAAFASATGYVYGDKVLFDIIEVDGPVVLTNNYGDAAGTAKNKNVPFGRVNYHTTDVKGNMIIDKPYPMQNWLLNFYKRIIL